MNVHKIVGVLFLSIFINYVHAERAAQKKPLNLAIAKKQVRDYYRSGALENEFEEVTTAAWEHLKTIPVYEDSVVVIDIHETALSNYEYFERRDFNKGSKEEFLAWKIKEQANVIKPTLELYKKLIEKYEGFKKPF